MAKRKKNLKKIIRKAKAKKASLHYETKKGIFAVSCFALAILSVLSFFEGAGVVGQYFQKVSRLLFGQGFFLVPIVFVLAGLAVFTSSFRLSKQQKPVYRAIIAGITLFILSVLGIFHVLGAGAETVPLSLTGGYFGLIFGWPLINFFGFWAGLVTLFALLVISILLIFNISLIPLKKKPETEEPVSEKAQKPLSTEEAKTDFGLWQKIKDKTRSTIQGEKIESEEKGAGGLPSGKGDRILGREDIRDSKEKSSLASEPIPLSGEKAVMPVLDAAGLKDFKLPPLNFLEKDKGRPTSGDIKANINIIKRTLENFGIEVEMAEVNVGPTVTQYTLRPAQGMKLSRITALHNDLALALAAHPLRIEAPIPSRSLIGIEIPNRSVVMVRLRTLLERPTFQEAVSNLTFALGRDVAGNPLFTDLSRMPHLMVAGATGTGKTIALNNLIMSLLYRNTPDNLKMILIDPKRVELTSYNSIPHLLTPVIVEPEKAVGALRWAVSEMTRRFEILQEADKKDVTAYNKALAKDDRSGILPYIIIVIDELADLMSSYGREAEATIVRLAQMARAVGIHLIVSTQRPSVEVITGLIKANITSRMAFQVASQIDSRTVLDMAGAEKLLGNGDMLFLAGNSAKPRRVQGVYISDKEIKKVVDYLKKAKEPDYSEEVASVQGIRGSKTYFGGGSEADDELYEDAKEVVIQAGKASASLLQRRLRVGYARAARLLDIMEERGIVGPADGARPRDVYVDEGVRDA